MSLISYSCLEDLSNELFYEIFQYLDTFDVYKGFYNLNQRLQNILCQSTVPLKINLSLMSKSNFEEYNRQYLIPNRRRIQSLYISNKFIADLIFVPIKTASSFLRLEILVFDDVKPKYFPNLFRYLANLPNLSALILLSTDFSDNLFELIFGLLRLKYCKITFNSSSYDLSTLTLPNTEQTSSIKHLIIKYSFKLKNFIDLISYLPYIEYLSIESLEGRYKFSNESMKTSHLKKIQFDYLQLTFDQFELMSRHLFEQLEILRLYICMVDELYLNAHRWEQLISISMPKLRIFDFEYVAAISTNDYKSDLEKYESIKKDFSTFFWTQRNWLFDYQLYGYLHADQICFFSIDSKRKAYTMYKERIKSSYPYGRPNVNYVDHIIISDEETILDCNRYFPYVTQLNLRANVCKCEISLASNLKKLISLEYLVSLIMRDDYLHEGFIRLLNAMPNIRKLNLGRSSISEEDLTKIKESEIFQSVSKTNKITNITIEPHRSLLDIELFVYLCPQMRYLGIYVRKFEIENTIQYILSNKQTNLRHLCLLQMKNIKKSRASVLRIVRKNERLLDHCDIKHVDNDFYFWF